MYNAELSFQKNKMLGAMLNSWWAKDDSPLDVMG